MGTFILKRKYFADSENNSGSNLGKIALGTGIAAAGAFAAGRRGLLGQNIAKSTNVAWGKLGNTLGSKGMVTNASRKYFKYGLGNEVSKEAVANGLKDKWTAANTEFRNKVGATDMFKQQKQNGIKMAEEYRAKQNQTTQAQQNTTQQQNK